MGKRLGTSVATLDTQLRELAASYDRKIVGESLTTLLVGLVTSVVVYGVVFWLSWLAFTIALPQYRIGSAATTALLITAVAVLVSVFSAWRKHDPFQNVQGMDPKVQGLQMSLGYAMGIPIVNRQSLAGIASLLIGGPANIMDAIAIWRTRLRADARTLESADQLLRACRQGVAPSMTLERKAVALLYRLGLIKAVQQGDSVMIQATAKGMELLGSR